MKQVNITFFGDSVCVGQGISIHDNWVSRISEALEGDFTNVLVSNSSVNGRTTRQALETFPYEIQAHPPHILIIQFGLNDCNRWESDKGLRRVSIQSFRANLEEMIERAKHFGVSRVCLHTNHKTAKVNSSKYEEDNILYNSCIRDISKKYESDGVILNDIEEAFIVAMKENKVTSEYYVMPAPDLLHLNREGHALYFDITHPLLCKVIRDIKNEQ